MRRAAAVDRNQSEIVSALRQAGVTVQPLHRVGEGCPDLLCGFRGRNVLLEVKDGELPPSRRGLTPDQVGWHGGWKGSVAVVTCVGDALRAVLEAGDPASGPTLNRA
jgi:hypothetical protein